MVTVLTPMPSCQPTRSSTTCARVEFPSLQLQCLYLLVGRLEEYSSQALSLLPVALRRKLLLHLPVVDIYQREKDEVFMSGINSDDIWRALLQDRISFANPENLRKSLEFHLSAKDVYMSEVSLNLLTHEKYLCRYTFPLLEQRDHKCLLIAYMLFGTQLECDANHAMLSLSSLNKNNSLGMTWLTTQRYYSKQKISSSPLSMVKTFLDIFKWYPKRLYLTDTNLIDHVFRFGNARILQSFLSQVETVCVDIDDYSDYKFAASLRPIWLAMASTQPMSLTSIILSACVTNLGDLMSNLMKIFFTEGPSEVDFDSEEINPFFKFSGFKRIELLGNDGGTRPHEHGYTGNLATPVYNFIPFLAFQHRLETLVVQGFQNIVKVRDEERYGISESTYKGFDAFYNYLPYVISMHSFKSLHVESCKVPSNTIKSMISTFLSCPTTHCQSLRFIHCDIVTDSSETYAHAFPLIKPTRAPCVCGEFKSLSIRVNNPLLPIQWLFEYPSLQLKRLELTYEHHGSLDVQSQIISFQIGSIKELCCKFHNISKFSEIEAQAVYTLLQLTSLSEVEFLKCHNIITIGLLSIMTKLFSPLKLASLKQLKIKEFNMNRDDTFGKAKVQSFFDALFSIPKDQLAEFTLELEDIGHHDDHFLQKQIVSSWNANSRGQKIKRLTYLISNRCASHEINKCIETPIYEPLPTIAINVTIDVMQQII